MPLPPLYGHEGIRSRLVGAIASGRLPQALLFEGPRGVGKQRLALWLAQLLMCEKRQPSDTEPCQVCRPCKSVALLQHPDVHWFVPVELTKRGADADKQVELVEEALAVEMAARRDQPLYEGASGLAAHGIASVRLLLRRLALTPALAKVKVFILGDAERLIPQRSSPEAANALLKALEEPPADTLFVLTTSEPEALLPTIVSRVARMRIGRVQDSVVTAFVQHELNDDVAARDMPHRVAAVNGCIGLLASTRSSQADTATVEAFRTAVGSRAEAAARYGFALRQPPFQARGGFTAMLDALLERLRVEVKAGSGDPRPLVAAIAHVAAARDMAQGNVNPQLLTAVLATDLVESA